MGWTFYGATEFKNGRIDRKKECEKLIGDSLIKGALRGTTYYAAVKGEDGVFALILLTSVDGWFFGYKDMTENMGPYKCECPLNILKLLSPTENELAKEWRNRCINYHKSKKNIESLPVGTKITLNEYDKMGFGGNEPTYTKFSNKARGWVNGIYYIPKTRILDRGFKVIDESYILHETEVFNVIKEDLSKAAELKDKYNLSDSWFKKACIKQINM